MKELISPAQSEVLVIVFAVLVALVAGYAGFREFGKRGWIFASLGPLIYVLWRAHTWVTRYDARSGYFGLEKVTVLLGEIFAFVVLGVVLGSVWKRMQSDRMTGRAQPDTISLDKPNSGEE
ncbi:MAG TPA: hypothetical protein VF719_07660 [Abditibacteriaceae bacterium]|jgi:hypothetical protein